MFDCYIAVIFADSSFKTLKAVDSAAVSTHYENTNLLRNNFIKLKNKVFFNGSLDLSYTSDYRNFFTMSMHLIYGDSDLIIELKNVD